MWLWKPIISSRWRHNGSDGISNHQPHDCLLNRLFRHRSKKTSKLRVTDLCVGNSPGTGEFPAQMASYAENISIIWRLHVSFSINVLLWAPLVAYFLTALMAICTFALIFARESLFFLLFHNYLCDDPLPDLEQIMLLKMIHENILCEPHYTNGNP